MCISEPVLQALKAIAPRRVRKALQDAYGKAAYAGRNRVEVDDLPPLDNAVRSIGFL